MIKKLLIFCISVTLISCNTKEDKFKSRYREGDFVYMKLDSSRGLVVGRSATLMPSNNDGSGEWYGRYTIRFALGKGEYEDKDVYSFEVYGEGVHHLGEARDSIYISKASPSLPNPIQCDTTDRTAKPQGRIKISANTF